MKIRRLRAAVGTVSWIIALCFAGCRPAQQPAPEIDKASADAARAADEARGVAETSLGKQAEILARGDLALNGREQLLVVNRFSAGARVIKEGVNPPPIFFTRASILEKDGGKWSEILRCDEHLKNPNGYLGGSPAARVSGWRLEYSRDAKDGLEMKITPAEGFDALPVKTDRHSEPRNSTFHVRWNRNTKRYQSFDQSHERYLSEVPSLETPQSTLR